MQFSPKKLYYKIREVSKIVGVQAHVLRYWETEFPSLSPPKSKSGHRIYRPKDIELLLRIRKLLYEDGFTIAGARRKLSALKTAVSDEDAMAGSSGSPHGKIKQEQEPVPDKLKKVKSELENILTLLDRE